MKATVKFFGITLAGILAFAMAACENPADSADPDDKYTNVITITIQPVSTNVTVGNISGSLAVGAAVTGNATLSYQWYRNMTNIINAGGTPLPGETGQIYHLPATLSAGVYYYSCEITAQGAATARSNVATVNVTSKPTLRIANFRFIDDNVKTYNGGSQGVNVDYTGEGINTEGISPANAGEIAVYYSGRAGTTYAESKTAPANAGTYDVKAETEGGSVFSAFARATIGTLTINRRQLTIGELNGSPTMEYDGTTEYGGSEIIIGSLDNLISGDEVEVSIASAAYNSANVANATQITVIYAISGTDSDNYLAPANETIPATITKAGGATVSVPAPASISYDSITISAAAAPGNGQTVQYAISSSSAVPEDDWQTGLSFSGLVSGTGYYIFAQAVGNSNYNDGPVQTSAVITTLVGAPFAITFNQITDAAPDISSGITIYRETNNGTTRPQTATLTVSNPGSYDSISWKILNVDADITGAGPSFTLDASNSAYNLLGEYFVTVSVRIDGVPYSKRISFTVAY